MIHEEHEASRRILSVPFVHFVDKNPMTDNTFQLSGFVLPVVNEDPFGVWDVVPAARGVSFAVGEAAPPEEPLHRASFTSIDAGRAQLQVKQNLLSRDRPIGQRRILRGPDRSAAGVRAA
jgi:hypothetical protein